MKKITALLLTLILCLGAIPALADVYSNAGFIKKIPMKPKYTEAVDNKGTVVKLNYTAHSYALEAIATGEFEICENANGETILPEVPADLLPEAGTDIMVEKELYVYLPYGYEETKDYNVLYLMHGGGEDAAYWLSEERMGKGTLAVLDRMMDKGEMESTIIVCPTFYS